jgi:hypothetical protein
MLIHLYLAFWRPDIRDELVKRGSPIAAMCDFVGNAESVVTDTRNVTCPACRETFLNAMPTGDGSKLTWAAYLASPQSAPRVTLAQRAAQADAAELASGWSTTPTPAKPPDVWATTPIPTPTPPGSWTTGDWQTQDARTKR